MHIDSKLKNLKTRENDNSSRASQLLEQKLKSNRDRHPEPEPNSLISGLLQQKSGHKLAKVERAVISSARDKIPVYVENKQRLD